MPITSTGISSGLDVESLVTQLVAADIGGPARRLDSQEASYLSKVTALGSLKGAVSGFQSALTGISSGSTYQGKSASSTDAAAVGITANKGARPSNYSVSVSALATEQSLALAGTAFSSISDPVGTGTVSITDGAATTTITVDSNNNSLAGLADAINASAVKATANIVNDGSGYRLLLTADETGLANALTIAVSSDSDGNDTDNAGLSRFASANLTQTVAASDAAFTVNGLAMSSSTNLVTTAIENVSLNLKKTTTAGETVSLSIADDTSSVTASFNGFLKGYNDLMKTLNELSGYNSATGRGSVLTGDATIRTLQSNLRSLVNSQVQNYFGPQKSLADLGVTTSASDGSLSVNDAIFSGVLSNDPLDVANVLAAIGRSASPSLEFEASSIKTQEGIYSVSLTAGTPASITSAVIAVNGNTLDFSGNNKDVQFTATVDGTTSTTITLNGDYSVGGSDSANLELLRTALQSGINAALPNNQVTVAADDANLKLTISSASAGASSSISFTEVVRLGSLGLDAGTSSTSGSDAVALMNGGAAVYDATKKTITGAVGTSVEGLAMKVVGNASGDFGNVVFSKGLGSKINDLLTGILADDGLIDARVDGLNTSVKQIADQRAALELRSSALERRYRTQFNSLETLISQLNTTQTFLTQALGGFVKPFSAVKK
ncbi:flagellar filament capping protein FliD [Pseudomonadales bacterium]|nr:flagellar filament capping protein FliD [Pseudomonadales bacterium]